MEGYIKLSRKIADNDFYFNNKFDYMRAWIDLLILAWYKPQTVIIKGIPIDLNPGELCYSMLNLAVRWQWDTWVVSSFLKFLKKRKMIHIKISRITTIITILNWDKYQNFSHINSHLNHTSHHTNNNIKKEKERDELRKILKRQYEMEGNYGKS